MIEHTILRDNREKYPWSFDSTPATTRDETINTGDYTISELCDHDEERNTYKPNYAIERKSGSDLVDTLTRGYGRFQKEVKRASDWRSELLVLVEEPKWKFRNCLEFFSYTVTSSERIFNTIDLFENEYNVCFEFVNGRGNAQKRAFEILESELASSLVRAD
jgi:hypothetical protein